MTSLPASDRHALHALARLADCNPFLPERVQLERSILGPHFVPSSPTWHALDDRSVANPNNLPLLERATALCNGARAELASAPNTDPALAADLAGAVHYLLYLRFEDRWFDLIEQPTTASSVFSAFSTEALDWLTPLSPTPPDTAHLFALGFQIRRAFHHIFRRMFGGSTPMARLRASVWQSIFTHNPTRYRRSLFANMAAIPTLITGESGTGKELVAHAIATSQYIPFDPKSGHFTPVERPLLAVNLAALSPTVIESEVFGHAKGSFTGANDKHAGWLENCHPNGAVFLDEIGELHPNIQVKLLRVLQTREFNRLGETQPLQFRGKLIAATNRNLAAEIAAGTFRADFYYRICGDSISTPTLREQLADTPSDLAHLVRFAASRLVDASTAGELANEVVAYISHHLAAYHWPGNIRELEQCTRSILVHGAYHPPSLPGVPASAPPQLVDLLLASGLTADDVSRLHIEAVFRQTNSLSETAKRLGVSRVTARKWLGGEE